ncbi:hypothetical protein [Spiribacter onubensis]|uniref:Uncharacterized protein n=1 Tax=Spiribacter onubensis TaxID=3122420 RepID=A0ABV3SA00_9GAMM
MMDDAPIAPTELNQDVLALVEAQDSPRLTKKAQKARDIQFNTNLPVTDRVALTNKAGENFAAGVQRATDENAGRGLLLGLLSPFAEPAIDLAENYAEARRVNAENAKLAESYGVDPGFIGEVGIGDMTSAAIGESTGGLIGGQNSGFAAITGTKQAAGPRSISGKGNIQQPVTPPSPIGPTPSPQQAADSGSQFGAGEVNGYASYARRVFSRI